MKEPTRGSWASAFGPLLIYLAFIFYKGTSQGVDTPFQVSDKILHAVSFGGMVVFTLRAVRYFLRGSTLLVQVAAAVAASSFAGALLEFVQWFLPYRTADVFDWLADTVGGLVVGAVLWVFLGFFGFETKLGSRDV